MYSSPNILLGIKSRTMRSAGHVTSMGYSKGGYRVPVKRPKERGHVEDLGVDGKNNIKMDLQEAEWGGMDWIFLAEDRNRLL